MEKKSIRVLPLTSEWFILYFDARPLNEYSLPMQRQILISFTKVLKPKIAIFGAIIKTAFLGRDWPDWFYGKIQ